MTSTSATPPAPSNVAARPAGSTPCWDFGDPRDRAEAPIHRIHSYPAKFPAFITTTALQYAEQRHVDVKVVADVFCGCGTTAVEAKRNGKNFWGCDINPVATLIAKVKTRDYRDDVLTRYFHAIQDAFRRTQLSQTARQRTNERIRYWFDDRRIDDLLRLSRAIRKQVPATSPYRGFFLCALSNILKPTSRWLTKSIKAQLDPDKSPRDVMEAFCDQFTLMRNACAHNPFPARSPRVHIRTRNFLAPAPPPCQADLILTSPPYVTSYDYADIHQLSVLWLGYASDYRTLRKNMLGNQYGVPRPDPTAVEDLGQAAHETYRRLFDRDRRKADSVARYFLDMDRTALKCHRMLNQGGMAVFVIGNTQYQGVRIDNAAHLAHCMRRADFRDIETISRKVSLKTMTPYRDARGRFTRDSTQRKVYGEEFVVIGSA